MELSIVIPIYNVEAYIGRCLDSVSKIFGLGLACEGIIVNDGTPDGSMAIVEDYAKKYPHIKIINQDNQGLGEARNVGLRHACGEYVYFLDSDDTIKAENLVTLFRSGYNSLPDVLVGNYSNIVEGENRHYLPAIIEEQSRVYTGEDYFNRYYVKSINILVVQGIYKKSFLLDNNLFFTKGIFFEDVNWMPKMLLHANAIYYKNICIYNYYLRQGSIIRSEYTLKKFHDILFIAEDLLKLSSKKLRRKTQKNIGYLAIVGTSVSIGRILKDNSLTVSDRKSIDRIFGWDTCHYFYIHIYLWFYKAFPVWVQKVLKSKYSN